MSTELIDGPNELSKDALKWGGGGGLNAIRTHGPSVG